MTDVSDYQLVFEVIVLGLVVFNALSRPRGKSTSLRHMLYRDGILFFTVSLSLHIRGNAFSDTPSRLLQVRCPTVDDGCRLTVYFVNVKTNVSVLRFVNFLISIVYRVRSFIYYSLHPKMS